jgi:hypothetical protein
MCEIRFKFSWPALVILLNDVISHIIKKFIIQILFGRIMELLPLCSDFGLKLLEIIIKLSALPLVYLMVFHNQIIMESFVLKL